MGTITTTITIKMADMIAIITGTTMIMISQKMQILKMNLEEYIHRSIMITKILKIRIDLNNLRTLLTLMNKLRSSYLYKMEDSTQEYFLNISMHIMVTMNVENALFKTKCSTLTFTSMSRVLS